jgi:hypothetical protein
MRTTLTAAAAAGVLGLTAAPQGPPPAHAEPSADQVLTDMGVSAAAVRFFLREGVQRKPGSPSA